MSETSMLDERYQLGEVIGRGGMAEVRRGEDLRLGRTVAVKTLRFDLTGDPTFQARFRREAQSAAALNHPDIVAVYDTGEDLLDGRRVPYIVMEYVEGRTLRDLLHDPDVRITHERALEITAGVLDALEYSHRAGIVHRDIKPANVMVTARGEVKVMDFGIARTLHDSGATMTQTAAVVGTAQYLSPEQARGEQADTRSDLYSLGCLLYELLTGRPPFVGDSLVSVAVSHVRDDPAPPSVYDRSIPREIDQVVMTALAKDRDDRYQSAAEMRADIERVLAGLPVERASTSARTQYVPGVLPGATALAPGADARPLEDDEPPRRSRAWLWVLLILLVLGILGVVGWLLLRGAGDEVPTAAVPSVVDKPAVASQREITAAGFEVETRSEFSTVRANAVISQDPAGGSQAPVGSTVRIVVSRGAEQVVVPRLVGLSIDEAQAALQDQGLQLGPQTPEESTQAAGTVLSSDPESGSDVAPGSAVAVTVASGEITMPDVVGQDGPDAEVTLRNLGLRVERQGQPSDEEPGSVVSQAPAAGTTLEQGNTVIIVLAEPEPPPTSPPATPTQTPTGTPEPTEAESPGGGGTDSSGDGQGNGQGDGQGNGQGNGQGDGQGDGEGDGGDG